MGPIVERDDLGTLWVTGTERQSWLGRVLTCEVAGLAPGRGAYGLVLARNGHILSDVTVVVGAEAACVGVARGDAARVYEYLDRLLIMEDVQLGDRSADMCWFWGFGPSVPRWVAQAVAEPGVVAAEVKWPGLAGAALVVPAERRVALQNAWLAGDDAGGLADASTWERMRIEAGFPRFGVDFDSSHTVHEASLEQQAVCWTKGCYVGQDVVARQQSRGPSPSRLVSLALESESPPPIGAAVEVGPEARRVGQVTSAAFSPRRGRAVAVARVASAQAQSGTHVRVAGVAATVTDLTAIGASPGRQ